MVMMIMVMMMIMMMMMNMMMMTMCAEMPDRARTKEINMLANTLAHWLQTG